MNKKTQKVLLRIIKEHGDATITVIMKTCYLIDLIATQKIGKQITELNYIRYNYGPFNPNIYKLLMQLISDGLIHTETSYFGMGNEVITYKAANDIPSTKTALSRREKTVVDEVLSSIRGLGAKMLTEITYQTEPMKKLGATLGGNENVGKRLNLDV